MEKDQQREPEKHDERPKPERPPNTEEHPAPGVKHEPEPDAENMVPAKHKPGTL